MATKKKPAIKYTNRDFASIKNGLVEYAKRYYPNTFKDFNDASFGSLMLDTVAYVGDILSFYLDYQANETFLDTAIESRNILKLARQMGYKYQPAATSHGIASFYVLVPASAVGASYDKNYLPVLKMGSSFSTSDGNIFTLMEDVDFSKSSNDVLVAEVDSTSGQATSFALKAYGKVLSGEYKTAVVEVGAYKRFRTILLSDTSNVAEVISIFDAEGNEYFEVDYLSQDVIYRAFTNPREADKELAPKIIKPIVVPRRFVVDRDSYRTFLQFGYGSESDLTSDLVVDPSKMLMKIHAKDYVSDATFDPYNLISSDKFGVVPSNTTLTIVYRVNSSANVNVPVGSLNQIVNSKFTFKNTSDLLPSTKRSIRESLEINNEEPIIGDSSHMTTQELRTRAYGSFHTQSRAVTKDDYKTLIYSMPNPFGVVKKCNLYFDKDSLKRNINLYVLVESTAGHLITANSSIKQNVKTWLNKHKMLSDTIDILDAKVVNLGVDFVIMAESNRNKFDVQNRATLALINHFNRQKQEIGEDFHITSIFRVLNNVEGVADTIDVRIKKKTGSLYSDINFDIESNMSSDRRYILIPENVIYELKFPYEDIKGVVK